MKKIYTLIAASAISLSALAQIPNAGFETWNQTDIISSGTWNTIGNVSRDADKHSGNYSIKLENIDPNKDANFYAGFFANIDLTTFDGQGIPPGGQPYSDQPDSFEGWFKYDLAPGDTASIIFGLKSNGAPIAANEAFISGSSGGNYVRLAWKLNYIFPTNPDTMIIIMFSSDPNNDPKGDGYIMVDDLKFFSSGGPNANVKGGGMENWKTDSYFEPEGWITANSFVEFFGFVPDSFPVIKSTVAASGSSAFEAYNISVGGGEFLPGAALSSTELDEDKPGFEVDKRYLSLRGVYQYQPVNGDSAYIGVKMFKDGGVVGEGLLLQGNSINSYTFFSIDITYDGSFSGTPDSAIILLSAANPDSVRGVGSRIWVDDLNLSIYKTSVNPVHSNISAYRAYPNPFAGSTTIEFTLASADDVTIKVYDLAGKEVATVFSGNASAGNHKATFNATGLQAGVYFYEITTANGKLTNKLIIE